MAFFNSLPGKFHLFLMSLGLFVHFLATALTGGSTVYVQQNIPVATTTLPITIATSSTPKLTATTTAQTKAVAHLQTSLPVQKQTAVKIIVPQSPDNPSVQASADAVEALNAQTRAALVNILCTTAEGGSFNPISGSGVFIDSRGVILTNAHVAQYFLLENYLEPGNVQCVIRQGSPAAPVYTAQVMYLPPEWIEANASQLTADHATGTGENDYAFLQVTGTVSPSVSLPSSFPALAMSVIAPEVGAPVLLAAYPAQLLDGETIQENLYSSSAVSTVDDLYSFDGQQHVDLISLGGSVVSQTGSSGGALVGVGSGKLLGIIATETTGTTTADRELNAVTIGFIDRSLSAEGMGSLSTFLSEDPSVQTANFQANIEPQEISELEAVLNKVSN